MYYKCRRVYQCFLTVKLASTSCYTALFSFICYFETSPIWTDFFPHQFSAARLTYVCAGSNDSAKMADVFLRWWVGENNLFCPYFRTGNPSAEMPSCIHIFGLGLKIEVGRDRRKRHDFCISMFSTIPHRICTSL